MCSKIHIVKNRFTPILQFLTAQGGNCSKLGAKNTNTNHKKHPPHTWFRSCFGSQYAISSSIFTRISYQIYTFDHVPVTLCTKCRNVMDLSENCSDAYKLQKMNAFRSHLPPGSVQNDAQKRWNLWKSVKIVENPRWVPYKNLRKIKFWARPGNSLQKSVIFTSGIFMATFR